MPARTGFFRKIECLDTRSFMEKYNVCSLRARLHGREKDAVQLYGIRKVIGNDLSYKIARSLIIGHDCSGKPITKGA